MKRKNDDLLRLAFGELSTDAAEAVEARAAADPASWRELEAYRDLRVGLQHLPPPPPDGLSTERLRAAILDRELKTRRPTFAPLAWAPMALAAFAAVVFLARPLKQGDPTIVAKVAEPSYRKLIKVPEFNSPLPMALAKQQEKKVVVPPPVERVASRSADDEVMVRPASRRRRDRSRARNSSTPLFAWYTPKEGEETVVKPASLENKEPQSIAPPSSVVSPNNDGRVATNTDDTVVIISTQRDLETGAHAASETEAGSVLVGG